MIDAHLRKLRARQILSSAEEAAIRSTVSGIKSFSANTVLARAGERLDYSLLVVEGWLARSKRLTGCDSQITGLGIPGDHADLHGLVLGCLDYDVIALTGCAVAVIPHARLEKLFERHPNVSRIYQVMSNVDAAIERERCLSLGRRSRAAHMAHLFCELFLRLETAGDTFGTGYEFPLTQNQLSDCLGATPVHVNRVLQQLRGSGMMRLERRLLTILDHEALRAFAKFDPGYLFMERVTHSTMIVEGEVTRLSQGAPTRVPSACRAEVRAQP